MMWIAEGEGRNGGREEADCCVQLLGGDRSERLTRGVEGA